MRLNYKSFEAVEAKLLCSGKSMSFVCLYRPPPSRVNKFTDKMFQDFNYHFDCTSCPHVKQLQTLFSDNCLTQLIRDPTHCCGYILDILDRIVVRENNGSVSNVRYWVLPYLNMMPLQAWLHGTIHWLTAELRVAETWEKSTQPRYKLTSSTSRHWAGWLLRLWSCRPVQCRPTLCPGPTRPTDQQESDQPSVSPLEDRQRQNGQKGTPAGWAKVVVFRLDSVQKSLFHQTLGLHSKCTQSGDNTTMMWYVIVLLSNNCITLSTSCSVEKRPRYPIYPLQWSAIYFRSVFQ